MTDWFYACVKQVLAKEGWGEYTNTPGDPGGPTRWGISLRMLSAWRGKSCTAQDVQALEEAEALDIYRQEFWHLIAGDQLPPGINLMTFDCAVNQGPGHAVRWLQAAAGVPADGILGSKTLQAVAESLPSILINSFKQERLSAYQHDAAWQEFKNGWSARDDAIAALAIQWAAQPGEVK